MNMKTSSTKELKARILQMSYGGIMYDITEGSELNSLVRNNDKLALELVAEIEAKPDANGLDNGVMNYIKEVLA